MDTMEELGLSSDRVSIVTPDDLPTIWPQISAIITEFGQTTLLHAAALADLYQQAIMNDLHIWVALSPEGEIMCVGICSVEVHAYELNYHVMWVGGYNLRTYLKLAVWRVEGYATLIGCHSVIYHRVRKGILRYLHRYGYTPDLSTVQKVLHKTNGVH